MEDSYYKETIPGKINLIMLIVQLSDSPGYLLCFY